MAKKRITTAAAKAKGRNLQKWVCERVAAVLGLPWGKDELVASREASQAGTDIRLVGEAKVRFPFSIECKWHESWAVHDWIKQAQSNQEPGTDWLLVAKRSRSKPVVIMDAERFFDFVGTIEQLYEGLLAELLQGQGTGNEQDTHKQPHP